MKKKEKLILNVHNMYLNIQKCTCVCVCSITATETYNLMLNKRHVVVAQFTNNIATETRIT